MNITITSKYNIGDKFNYFRSLNSEPIKCRIGRMEFSITKEGHKITYFMDEINESNHWTELFNGSNNVNFNDEINLFSNIKEIDGEKYVGKTWEINTDINIGDEVISKVNLCEIGDGAFFAGNIFEVECIKYKVGKGWSYGLNDEIEINYFSYGYNSLDCLKVDSFNGKINDGKNCSWRVHGKFSSHVEKIDNIDWVGKIIPKVVTFFKQEHKNPFKYPFKDGDYPYTVIFRYLGLEEIFKDAWKSGKINVNKKVIKKTKADEIIECLSEKEKKELLKKLSKLM